MIVIDETTGTLNLSISIEDVRNVFDKIPNVNRICLTDEECRNIITKMGLQLETGKWIEDIFIYPSLSLQIYNIIIDTYGDKIDIPKMKDEFIFKENRYTTKKQKLRGDLFRDKES